MEAAKSSLERIYNCLEAMAFFSKNAPVREAAKDEQTFLQKLQDYKNKFISAMDDDLNTADAISVIFEIVADANKTITAENQTAKPVIDSVISLIRELGGVLGLLSRTEEQSIPAEVQSLLDQRAEARKAKNWAESDKLREQLKDLGYAVKDTPQGQQLTQI